MLSLNNTVNNLYLRELDNDLTINGNLDCTQLTIGGVVFDTSNQGPRGTQGIGINNIIQNGNSMIITLDNNMSYQINNLKGETGASGLTGQQGIQGLIGHQVSE